jgi:hypothetical protein
VDGFCLEREDVLSFSAWHGVLMHGWAGVGGNEGLCVAHTHLMLLMAFSRQSICIRSRW